MAGFGQTLGIWLAAVAVAVVAPPSAAVGWLCLASGLASCMGLGLWHRRRGRVDTAVGSFAGLVAWPVIIGVVVGAIAAVALSSE